MIIETYSDDMVEKYKGKKCLVIADYRSVNYNDDCETEINKVADRYGMDLYPVCGEMNVIIIRCLNKYYGDYDVWLVEDGLTN